MVDVVYAHQSVIIDSDLSETEIDLNPASTIVSVKALLRELKTVGEGEIIDYYVGYENDTGSIEVHIHEIGIDTDKSLQTEDFPVIFESHVQGHIGFQAIPITENHKSIHYELFLFEGGTAGPQEDLIITRLAVTQEEDLAVVQNQFIASLPSTDVVFGFDVVQRKTSEGRITYDLFVVHLAP